MTIEEILHGENQYVEFKGTRPEAKKYMKTIVAFANGKGGRLVFGVEDETRKIIGVPEEKLFSEIDAITNAISDMCKPMIVPDIYPQTFEGKTVIVVEISAGKKRPYYLAADGLANGVYIRVAGTTRHADQDTTRELYYDSEGRSYDTMMVPEEDITEEEIADLCKQMEKVAISNCISESQRRKVKKLSKNNLLNWGIISEDGRGRIKPTNAYNYLLGKDVFHSVIQCGVFKGTSRAVFLDKKEYTGPLWQQVEDAHQFVLRNIRLGAKIKGVYRQDIFELPPDSIRELIVNAVMNYSFLQSSNIQINLFDDRLEITTPGGLMPGVTISKMKEGYSQIRNKALASAFSYMKLIEGWGTGIPRLFEEMRNYGLQEPEFIDWEDALRINLYRSSTDLLVTAATDKETNATQTGDNTTQDTTQVTQAATKTTQGTTQAIQDATQTTQGTTRALQNTTQDRGEEYNLTKDDIAILRILEEHPKFTQREIADILHWKLDRVKYYTTKLKKNHVIERIGTSQKGCWKILVEDKIWQN